MDAVVTQQRLTFAQAYSLAATAAREGRLTEAEGIYRTLLATRAAPEVPLNLGLVLEDQGRYEDAEALYRAELAERPGDPDLERRLAFQAPTPISCGCRMTATSTELSR